MKRARGWVLYAVLIAAAVGFALAAGTRVRQDSPVPSVRNPSGAGAKALFVYLRESGYDVRAGDEALLPVPPEVKSVVLALPMSRRMSAGEVKGLRAFVEGGGRLVVLARSVGSAQPELDSWLKLGVSARPEAATVPGDPRSEDPGGVSVEPFLQTGLLAGVRSFRVSNEPGITVGAAGALPVAGAGAAITAWWIPSGQGEVWVFAGTDVLENRRIELGDNLAFWTALARQGPVVFDEVHHRSPEPPPMSRGMLVLAGQLLVCFAFFAVARGVRLGPARPERVERHRSRLEYLQSFAWLTRRAKVERELLEAVYARFRLTVQERLGIPLSAPDEEVAHELEERCQVPRGEYLEAVRALQALRAAAEITPRQFAGASGSFAPFERVISGRAYPHSPPPRSH